MIINNELDKALGSRTPPTLHDYLVSKRELEEQIEVLNEIIDAVESRTTRELDAIDGCMKQASDDAYSNFIACSARIADVEHNYISKNSMKSWTNLLIKMHTFLTVNNPELDLGIDVWYKKYIENKKLDLQIIEATKVLQENGYKVVETLVRKKK